MKLKLENNELAKISEKAAGSSYPEAFTVDKDGAEEKCLFACSHHLLDTLDRHRDRVAAAEAEAGDAAFCSAAFHFVEQGRQHASA